MSETEVITLAQSGNPDAFTALYDIHNKPVFRRCMQMLHDEDEAQDLSQEIWLLVFRKLPQFRWKSDFRTWLFRLTTNRVVSYIRHKQIRLSSGAGDPPETFEFPDQLARLEIQEAVENLSVMQRFCVESGGLGGSVYLRAAQHNLRGQLACPQMKPLNSA